MAYDFIKNFLGKSASLQKYGHDLTNNEVVHQQFGVEAPIKHYFASPNEFYKLNVSGYVQTAPMREDNFADIKQELRAVYVPMSSIMRDYLSITSAEREIRRDDLVPEGAQFLFDLRGLLVFNFSIYEWYRILQFISSVPDIMSAIVVESQGQKYWSVNGTRLDDLVPQNSEEALYVGLFNSICFNHSYATPPAGSQIRFVFATLEAFVNPLSHQLFCFDVLRLLDNLGYGNYLAAFDSYFRSILEGLVDPTAVVKIEDNIFVFEGFVRDFPEAWFPDEKLDLFPILAYQYYINVARRSNYRMPYGDLYTADAFLNVFKIRNGQSFRFGFDLTTSSTGVKCYTFDFATYQSVVNSFEFQRAGSYLVDSLLNNAGIIAMDQNQWSVMIYLFGLSNPLLDSDVFTSSQLTVVSGNVPTTTAGVFNANPVQQMKDLEALYSLRQDLLRAGIRRDKQMESVFGVKGNAHVYEKIQILDVASHSINIDPVISTAETEEATLGERASRGNGKNNIHCSVKTDDYGFIFITSVFTCDCFYEAFGIERQHYLDSKSWYIPKFARLGLEPIRRKSVSYYTSQIGDGSVSLFSSSPNDTVGFSSHDWHLKTQVNIAHGLFTQFGFSSLMQNMKGLTTISNLRGNSIFGGFVPTLIDQQVNSFADVTDLYFRPDMVNNLFQQYVDFYLHVDPSYDFFKCAVHYGVHKVSTMPKIGLLNLNV